MNYKIITASIVSVISINAFSQESLNISNKNIEVAAKVAPGCFLEAENVNFGVLPMPLNNTSAQSKITVKCSRNTQLNISIDGMFASEIDYTKLSSSHKSQLQNNELTLEYRGYSSQTKIHTYFIGRWSTGGVGTFTCRSDGGGTTSTPANSAYQFFTAGVIACNNDGTLVNFNGTPTTDMKISLLDHATHATNGSGKKTLNGLSHGESIKYTVIKPETTDIWSSNYSLISNGESQNIPLKININKADNATHRMTPDTYQSTLTVMLDY